MRTTLRELLAADGPVLADGATGTNLFRMGLGPGEAPELWNTAHPDRVRLLHRSFVEAGSRILLTNTFGCNRYRLKLHGAEGRVAELATAGAKIAAQVAAAADFPVVVAGSVGPTGELLAPLGQVSEVQAREAFAEQIRGLIDGGADLVWIETMSAADEIRAAASAAIAAGIDYVVTCSFDTAGRTMMGLAPEDLPAVFTGLATPPLALGANCGVGAADILVSIGALATTAGETALVCKGNCGIPEFHGTDIVYSGTPELMGDYAVLAADAGARIVGGCCGTTPEHLVVMAERLSARTPADPPSRQLIEETIGPLVNRPPSDGGRTRTRKRPARS